MKKHISIKSILFLFLVFLPGILHAGIMEKPRKVYSLSTEHFNILFSNTNSTTAKLLADNIELMYEKAAQNFDYHYNYKKITILISPDSDTLSVTYTNTPYERIIIYDSVPASSDSSYKNGLLDLVNHEIIKAVSSSVTTKFWFLIRKHLLGSVMRPEMLLNMPFSFLEGAVSAEDYKNNTGILNDNWNLQMLTQAKLDGKFPSLIQVLGTMDTYPSKDFCRLAASAFCAYIQNRWGYEKFYEYWDLGGQVNFFFLHKGIFNTVYEITLEEAWQDFIDEIPTPGLVETDDSEIFISSSNESLYKYILHSPYGFIWYDELKGEIAIYDDTLGFQKYRRLLFMANDVTNLTLSPDGRFITISHTQHGSRTNFDVNISRVYDLKNRAFTGDVLNFRDSSLITLKDGSYALAGINVENNKPSLQIIHAQKTNLILDIPKPREKNPQPIFTRNFTNNDIPQCPIQLGDEKIACIVNSKNNKYILIINYITGEEEVVQLKLDDEILDIENLRLNNIDFLAITKTTANYALMFDYISKFQPSLAKTGIILLNKDFTLQQAVAQKNDYSGGINNASFYGPDLYYSSHKFDYDEFRKIPISKVELSPLQIEKSDIVFKTEDEFLVEVTESVNEKNKKQMYLGEFPVSNYNPFKYMINGAWMPFMPVKSVSFSEGVEQSPGLGLTFTTRADPFNNNQLVLSAGFGFLPTDITMIFNASEEERKDFDLSTISFFDDYTFAAFYKNSSTPIDILAGTLFTFNNDGQYNLSILGGTQWQVPLMMTFRRFTFDLEAQFDAATTYWDQHQFTTYPELQNWPSLKDSYRSIKAIGRLEYSNIHQFGSSPYKKMGVKVGAALAATWDLNLMELQREKQKQGTIESVKPENLSQAIENQLWGNPYAPTQINPSLYGVAEIPQLMPIQNYNNWIVSLPTTISAELFNTNGIALDLNFRTLILGREIQNGFNEADIYFPRAGLYFGYDVQQKYDTASVVLPDIREFTRLYQAFANTVLNDSIFLDLNFAIVPVVGQFSSSKITGDLQLDYFIRTQIWKFSFNIKFDL